MRILVDATKCTGCKSCELICSLEHTGAFNPGKSRIRVIDFDYLGYSDPVLCVQCQAPACVAACPVEALTQTESGTISLDEMSCNGCQLCVEACPYQAVNFNASADLPLICDLCDGQTKCVTWCPTGALSLAQPASQEGDPPVSDPISRARPVLKRRGIPDAALEWYRKFPGY